MVLTTAISVIRSTLSERLNGWRTTITGRTVGRWVGGNGSQDSRTPLSEHQHRYRSVTACVCGSVLSAGSPSLTRARVENIVDLRRDFLTADMALRIATGQVTPSTKRPLAVLMGPEGQSSFITTVPLILNSPSRRTQ